MSAMAPSSEEAGRISEGRLSQMRSLGYDELSRYCDHQLVCEVLGRDGVKYEHETDVIYDAGRRRGGDIRVQVEVSGFDGREWTDKLAGAGFLMSAEGATTSWTD